MKLPVQLIGIGFLTGVLLLPAAPAYGLTAKASSAEGEQTAAAKAVDGDFATRWSSVFSDSQWLEVDLGEMRDITGVSLFWESAFGLSYDIEVSKDATNWTRVYQVRGGDGALDDIWFARRACRYVRMLGKKRGTSWGYSLWELTVRGPEDEIRVSASSASPGSDAGRVLDGNPSTPWRSAPGDANPWLRLESTNGISCGGVELTWGVPYPKQYALEISLDGASWSAVCQVTNNRGGTIDLPVSVAGAPFLRVSSVGTGEISVADVRLRSWDELTRSRGVDVAHTIVGDEGCDNVTFVGRDGTFAPEPEPYQVTFWISADGVLHAPETLETDWRLRKGSLPVSEVRWKAGSLRVSTTTFGRRVDHLACPLTICRVTVENPGPEPREAALHALIRPNSLAAKWGKTLSQIARQGPREVRINDSSSLFLLQDPSSGDPSEAGISRALRLRPLREGEDIRPDASVRGGVLTFALQLQPGETRTLAFVAASDMRDSAAFLALDVDEQLAAVERKWSARVPLRLELPDTRYTDAFYASLNYILLMMKDDKLYPGPYNYKSFFLHDAVEMNSALDVAGLHDVARRVTPVFEFHEWGGYLDELGGSIYALFDHARMTRDRAFLEQAYPRILAGCELVRKLRQPQLEPGCEGTPLYGLLRKSVSQDNFTIPAHLYVDNWWAIIGLKCGVESARILGREEDGRWIEAEYESLLSNTVSSIRAVMKKEGLDTMPAFADYWPPDQRLMDAEHRILGDTQMAWAHRPPLFPGRALGIPVPLDLFRDSYRRYWERSGRFSGYDGGWYVEYEKLFWGYNAQLAIPPMYLGMNDVALKNIEWSLRHQAAPGAWAEGYVTCEGADGLRRVCDGPIIGDVPHGWSGSYYVLLLRNMLMREEDGKLVLLPCIPPSWVGPGKQIAMSKAPTHFGEIDWAAEGREGGILDITLATTNPPPGGYDIRLPAPLRIAGAEADGKPVEVSGQRTVNLPSVTRTARIRYDR